MPLEKQEDYNAAPAEFWNRTYSQVSVRCRLSGYELLYLTFHSNTRRVKTGCIWIVLGSVGTAIDGTAAEYMRADLSGWHSWRRSLKRCALKPHVKFLCVCSQFSCSFARPCKST